jgi:lipopolysaccharide transport system permease protein
MAAPLCRPVGLLWQHRRMLWQTAWNEVKGRYAGSVLGLAWLLIYPLLFLGSYAVIYSQVFQIRAGNYDTTSYILLIFCGLIPFLGFSEALSAGVTSVSGNASMIKNTLFPIDLLPAKAVLVAQCQQVAALTLLLVALAVTGKLTPWAGLLPIIWGLQFLFTVGLLWVLASLNVFMRDLQQGIGVVILILMIFSPIAYTAEMVPESLRTLFQLNPLYHFILASQDCLLVGRCPSQVQMVVMVVLAAVFFVGGHWFFERLKRVFADNV